ncbi:MAG: cytochrome c oxidase subunit II [Actinomycetota bacterium]|nr:cytochrome c oxidase subunit II [Actinomycetota bacterium]
MVPHVPQRFSSSRLGRLVALVALGLVLASCANGRLDATKPKGKNAEQIDGLMRLSGWMAVVVGIFVAAAVGIVMIKFRERPGDDPDDLPEQVHGNKKAELTWTLIPVGMLVFLGVMTLPVVFDLAEEGDGRTIKVEGQQWWWQFSYDVNEDGDYDDPEDFVTANDIVIPVGEEVNLALHSNDVIHSFWVPQLNGKKDVVPGKVQPWRISATEPGIFYGECTEFCGLSHANMQIRAIVLEQDDFDAWLASQQLPSEIPTSGSAQEGFELFAQHCTTCHVIDNSDERFQAAADGGAALKAGVAPNLTHLMSRTSFAGAVFDMYNDDGSLNIAELREWVRNAPDNKPMAPDNQQGMISFAELLSEDDLDNILAYLQTLGGKPILPN